MKKILTIIISTMIVFNLCFVTNSKSYAEEINVVEVSNQKELLQALFNMDTSIHIKLLDHIDTSYSIDIPSGKCVEVDLNNHNLISNITIKGEFKIYNGTIKAHDLEIDNGSIAGLSAINVDSDDAKLSAKNVTIIGTTSKVAGVLAGYGIYNDGYIDIESCIVKSGDAYDSVNDLARSAIYGDNGGGVIKNCTFIRGEGAPNDKYKTVSLGGNSRYTDENGNTLNNSNEPIVYIGENAPKPTSPDKEEVKNESKDVKATYTEGKEETIYNLNISWGAMDFTYNEGEKGKWDSATHEYIGATPGTWDYNGSNTIEVTNHSNTSINVKLSGNTVTDSFVGESSFTFCSNENLTNAISEKSTISSAVGIPIDSSDLVYKAFLKINGDMKSSETKDTVGSVTIEIN